MRRQAHAASDALRSCAPALRRYVPAVRCHGLASWILIGLLAACDVPGELAVAERIAAQRGVRLAPLSHRLLHTSGALGIPYRVAVVGQHLVVSDLATDTVIHVFARDDGRVVARYGRRGSGPDEFRGAWSIDPLATGGLGFGVYDFQLRRRTDVLLAAVSSSNIRPTSAVTNFVTQPTLTGPVLVGADRVLSLGLFTEGRVGVFDRRGRLLDVRGPLPPGPQSLAPSVRQHAYQATLVPDPDRRRLVALPRHASRLEFYEADGTPISMVEGPVRIEPRLPLDAGNRRGFAMEDDAPYGYLDGSATRGHIFALFSGRTTAASRDNAVFGRFVHVFDWSGRLRLLIDLGVDVLGIAVDVEATTLYGLRHDPTPAILAFSLPAVGSDPNEGTVGAALDR